MRRLWGVLAGVLATLAGLQALSSCVKYGPLPVYVESFSYQPAGPIHIGDSVTFEARIPRKYKVRQIFVMAGLPAMERKDIPKIGDWADTFTISLHDDGLAPDLIANDQQYAGSLQWQAENGTGTAQVVLTVDFHDNEHAQVVAPPLIVLLSEQPTAAPVPRESEP